MGAPLQRMQSVAATKRARRIIPRRAWQTSCEPEQRDLRDRSRYPSLRDTRWACGKQTPNRLICTMARNDAAAEIIAGFGRKYLWWEPVGKRPHSEDRIISPTMN